jgi:hypothetical protein
MRMRLDNTRIWSIFNVVHLDLWKERGEEMVMTHQGSVANEGPAGIMRVLIMRDATSTESKFF